MTNTADIIQLIEQHGIIYYANKKTAFGKFFKFTHLEMKKCVKYT
jgi:hypothetical protein